MTQRPGLPPFRRGIHSKGGRPWTIRQLAGLGTPADTNRRIRLLLDEGATGVSVLFDVPTIAMRDPTDPDSAGMVGVVGASVRDAADMEAVFSGVPLDRTSVSVVSHYPTNTAAIMALFLVAAERQGVQWVDLTGSCQNDFIMEQVVASMSPTDRIPPAASFDLQTQNVQWLIEHVPRWHPATFNGYNLREFGADLYLETAVALANAEATVEAVPGSIDRISFFFCAGPDFFGEVCRLRAAREAWYRLTGGRLRCHVQTSGLSLRRDDPLVNIARSSIQALSAVLGGCQSLHVDAYDEAISIPTEESALVALRTQQVLRDEIGIGTMAEVDPLGGSPFIEEMTDQILHQITLMMDLIRTQGGLVAAVESGWLEDQCGQPRATRSVSGPSSFDSVMIDRCMEAARRGASISGLFRLIHRQWEGAAG